MYYRFNADELMFEICDNRGRVLYMIGTEEEAKRIIANGGLSKVEDLTE